MNEEHVSQLKIILRLRDYSPSTIKSYCQYSNSYLKYLHDSHVNILPFNLNILKNFLIARLDAGLSPQTINLYLNSIKFFYRHVLNYKKEIPLKFAKKNKKIPTVLTREEINQLLNVVKNRKHKIILALAYGSGLRVSEIANLKVGNLRFLENLIQIKSAKGKKDRISILPINLNNLLVQLSAFKTFDQYVFESERGGPLCKRSLQRIFEKAKKLSLINQEATFHSLRHSFATHLIESGVNIRYIQTLLGHSSIKTTEQYTRVNNPALSNIVSPLNIIPQDF